MKKLKNHKGITMVSLIITIIIMVILAGVAISFTSNNGLVENAEEAVKTNKLAEDKEQLEITVMKILESKSIIESADLESKLTGWKITNDNEELKCISPNNNTFSVDKFGTISE